MRTRSPLLLLVAVLGLVAGACAGDGALGGPSLGGTPAAVVGDEVIANGDLEDEVESWASNEPMLQAIGVQVLGAEGRRPSDLVAFVLTHRLVSEQARELLGEDFARRGGEEQQPSDRVDFALLRRQLERRFAGETVEIGEVEHFVLAETAFKKTHVRRYVLAKMELESRPSLRIVSAPPGRRRGQYPPGTRLQFLMPPGLF